MFDVSGKVALTTACAELVSSMAEGDWLSYQDFGDRIEEVTGRPWTVGDLQSAVLRVDKRMIREGRGSVRAFMRGFKRLTAAESYQYMLDRRGKTRRQAKWMVESAARVAAIDELPDPQRHAAQQIAWIELRSREIAERTRHRPPAVGQ